MNCNFSWDVQRDVTPMKIKALDKRDVSWFYNWYRWEE